MEPETLKVSRRGQGNLKTVAQHLSMWEYDFLGN